MKPCTGHPRGAGELDLRSLYSLLGTYYLTWGLRVDFQALISVRRCLTFNGSK